MDDKGYTYIVELFDSYGSEKAFSSLEEALDFILNLPEIGGTHILLKGNDGSVETIF